MYSEVEAIRQRYARFKQLPEYLLYEPLNPYSYMTYEEKRRAFIRWIHWAGLAPVRDKRVLEIGCGFGDNLLQLISLGFQPENLIGNELLEERALRARYLLPKDSQVLLGDASTLKLEKNSFDVILQATVFTSILDDNFQQNLANHIWSLIKPNGGILWYDFIFNNPRNPDVRGVPIKRIYNLFPKGEIKVWRLTLAPPINRRITKIHPNLYYLLNMMPFLRTHALCWIKKS
ncbi:methyltransferase type 11 [Nostoc minutum NIES-26]|uniref:Methyltransferase type 11 n=1 Tax=Nostoc minutum NIES-26 TaxID=1844469 RepID=A0A367RLC1_9NOSO|nr:methyltransferase type 11 [Nostoc minutum NIES-26]